MATRRKARERDNEVIRRKKEENGGKGKGWMGMDGTMGEWEIRRQVNGGQGEETLNRGRERGRKVNCNCKYINVLIFCGMKSKKVRKEGVILN